MAARLFVRRARLEELAIVRLMVNYGPRGA